METYDLATAWCWEHDADFIGNIDGECGKRGITSFLIHPHNLSEIIQRIKNEELGFKVFFDRASDQEEAFDPLVEMMQSHGARMINDADHLPYAVDKAAMQAELYSAGINVPHTLVLPPWEEYPKLPSIRLEKVGTPFVVKPACGGCGDGVVPEARSTEDIQRARREFPDDEYLVQQKIEPIQIDGRRAWFRVFFAFGSIFPCWWDNHTRIAEVLSPSDVQARTHSEMKSIMRKAARISRLDLFSTEIALTNQSKLLVIDPINDQVDLRMKSKCLDGIPDQIVDQIVVSLVDWVKKLVRPNSRQRKACLGTKT